jgi:hypothetical protein
MRRSFLISLIVVFLIAITISVWQINRSANAQPVVVVTPAAALKTGWWIKIRTDRTECTSIDFQIGTKAEDRETWRTWHSSDPTEFDMPEKFLQVSRIYIQATANPQGKHAWFCLMYKDHGVKHFDLDNRQEENQSQTDSDGDCN